MYTSFSIENFRLFDKIYDAGARWRRRNTRLRSRLHICRTLSFVLCCILFVVVGGAACITGGEAELPTPTPDFEATIRAAVAQAVAPTPSPVPLPTFTPHPTPTPHKSATSSSSPTFGPHPTPTPRSPLADFQNGDYLEYENPTAAASIKALSWVADGIEQSESEAVEQLLHSAVHYLPVFQSVMKLLWVEDGVNHLELTAIESIDGIAYHSVQLAMRVANLAWVEDGVTEAEIAVIENLFFIADADVGLAERVADLPWVRDGITELEAEVTENLFFITNQDVALGHQVAGMTWLADDVTDAESSMLEELGYIAYEDAATATRLASMPFLRSLEPPDIVATESLASLAAFNAPAFREVMSHPTFSNGITDEWAPIVATLYDVSEEAPALVDILLDPEQVTQEWRTVALPHSGAVDLVIIRTWPGAQRSMDLLENAVRSAETFMGLPLPTNYVGLLFANTVVGYSAGTNYATHIAVLPEYDVDDGSENAEFAGHLIAHEVAHYYWARGRDWIDEGVSDLMASIAENARIGQRVEATNDPCGHTDNIAELERLTDLGNDDVFDCNYSLGEGFFLDLYRNLGDQAFREGLRHLYRMALIEDDDNYEGTQVGILHIEDAFRSDAARAVINRWYHGTAP